MQNLFSNLPHHERRRFRKHFLSSVHCELAFTSIPSEQILSLEDVLKEDLKALGFQEVGKIIRGGVSFKGDAGTTPSFEPVPATAIGLKFVSQEPKREVHVTSDRVTCSDFAYGGFSEFITLLTKVVNVLQAHLGVLQVNKTGLRKIDSIIAEKVESYLEACAMFNPSFFGALRSGLPAFGSVKVAEDAIVLEKDTMLSVLRATLTQLDSQDKYQANLDFDLVDRSATDAITALEKTLPKLNDLHFDLFMWAITKDLLNMLEYD